MIHLSAVARSHVQGSDEQSVGFCSYCGRLELEGQRVCPDCGLGVQLQTSARVLRSPGAAFLVVRGNGRVSAASAAAERMLSTHGELVGKPLMTLVVSREPEGALARAVAAAAAGDSSVADLDVELIGTVRHRARAHATIAACGLPPAALVLLQRA